jgi:hypothetical protein
MFGFYSTSDGLFMQGYAGYIHFACRHWRSGKAAAGGPGCGTGSEKIGGTNKITKPAAYDALREIKREKGGGGHGKWAWWGEKRGRKKAETACPEDRRGQPGPPER